MPDKIKTRRYKLKANLTADCKKNFAKNEKGAEITPVWQKGDRENLGRPYFYSSARFTKA